MAYLVLVRHGQSEWNARGVWTGWKNPGLTKVGEDEAIEAGKRLADIHFDYAYASKLLRAQQTLKFILQTINQTDLPTTQSEAINERNYGDYTEKNKWEVQKMVGDKVFQEIRRSWDYPIPNGESLKQVYERVVPYYEHEILPKLKDSKNILISAHGNSLRALVKYLENIPDNEISKLEIATGEVCVYQIDDKGNIIKKEIRKVQS